MSLSEIARDLQSEISQVLYIEADGRGQHYIATPFTYGDGDQPVVVLAPNQDGWMLSDRGTTLFRLCFQLNDAEYSAPENQRRLDSALAMAGISPHNGELTKPLLLGQYADAVFDFVHALLKIDELGDFPATTQQPARWTVPRPRFADVVAQLVTEVLPADRFEVSWNDKQWDHQKEYIVNGRINGMPTPLFMRWLTTITRATPPSPSIVSRASPWPGGISASIAMPTKLPVMCSPASMPSAKPLSATWKRTAKALSVSCKKRLFSHNSSGCLAMETGSNDQNPQPHTPHRKLAPHQPISVAAIHEGGALAGHPPVNRLYVWWARRPPAVSRATVAAALLNADADRDRFIRAIGATDAVVAERRAMDAIQASVRWSNVAFSNKRAFTHNLAPDRRRWFPG